MKLHPGLRLESTTCDTQVVVVRAPQDKDDVDLRCGGLPLRELGTADAADAERLEPTGATDGTLIGKRYVLEPAGLEVLCTRGGAGSLTVGDEPLVVKGAKPLPSSD